jgi:hypothetical protein
MHQRSNTEKHNIVTLRYYPARPDSTLIYSKVVSLAKENMTDRYSADNKFKQSVPVDDWGNFYISGYIAKLPKKMLL